MEIRDIRAEEAERVVELWPGGDLLTDRGRATITGWLRAASSHPLVFCLVGERDGEIIGFRLARLILDELGPGFAGELQEHAGAPDVARALGREAIERLRRAGCSVITAQVAVDEAADHELLRHLGLEHDVARFSLYG